MIGYAMYRALLLLTCVCACGSRSSGSDAGARDAGPIDAGLPDAGRADGGGDAGIPVPVPRGDWWQIAGQPDLGVDSTPNQQPVDFGIWQARDGTWQLWSCIRNTNVGG